MGDVGVNMANKTASGKCRLILVLPEEDYMEIERIAKFSGLSVNDIIRLRVKGLDVVARESQPAT